MKKKLNFAGIIANKKAPAATFSKNEERVELVTSLFLATFRKKDLIFFDILPPLENLKEAFPRRGK